MDTKLFKDGALWKSTEGFTSMEDTGRTPTPSLPQQREIRSLAGTDVDRQQGSENHTSAETMAELHHRADTTFDSSMNEWSDEFLEAVGGEENAAKIMQAWLEDLKNYHDFAFDDFYIPEGNEDPFGDELIDKLTVLIKGFILGRIANRVGNGERANSVGIRITVDSDLTDDKGEKSYARSSANRNKERLNFGQYYG